MAMLAVRYGSGSKETDLRTKENNTHFRKSRRSFIHSVVLSVHLF